MADRVRFIPPSLVITRGKGKGKGISSGGGAGFVQPVPIVTLDGTHSLLEGSAVNTVVGALTVVPEGVALSLFNDAGGKFKLVGSSLQATASATAWATATNLDVIVRASLYGTVVDTTINIAIISANVTNSTLSAATVADAAAPNVTVGNLASVPTGSTFTITDTAGGRFKVVGNVLKTDTVPVAIATGTYSVTVLATRGTKTFSKAFTITVTA